MDELGNLMYPVEYYEGKGEYRCLDLVIKILELT